MSVTVSSPVAIGYPVAYDYPSQYLLLQGMYQNLMTRLAPWYNLKIKYTIDGGLRRKLRRLQQLEEQIRQELGTREWKNLLRDLSRGAIDPSRIPDDELYAVLQKHAGLLGMLRDYNKKVINLSDILSAINDALLSKTEEKKYERPLTMGYH